MALLTRPADCKSFHPRRELHGREGPFARGDATRVTRRMRLHLKSELPAPGRPPRARRAASSRGRDRRIGSEVVDMSLIQRRHVWRSAQGIGSRKHAGKRCDSCKRLVRQGTDTLHTYLRRHRHHVLQQLTSRARGHDETGLMHTGRRRSGQPGRCGKSKMRLLWAMAAGRRGRGGDMAPPAGRHVIPCHPMVAAWQRMVFGEDGPEAPDGEAAMTARKLRSGGFVPLGWDMRLPTSGA